MSLAAIGNKASVETFQKSTSPNFVKNISDNDKNSTANSNNRPKTVDNSRKHNPLVIYPLENRIKSKKISGNAIILKNIIRKKSR